jgi:hypothetical protein
MLISAWHYGGLVHHEFDQFDTTIVTQHSGLPGSTSRRINPNELFRIRGRHPRRSKKPATFVTFGKFREACLTCSVFVTDTSYLDTLQRQLDETSALIDRTAKQFEKRHGKPMPHDNVWLAQRSTERDALVKLIATMRENPSRACQGAATPACGPIPITIDTTSYRKRLS